ncbi:YihY/virulence factor BrkB family protein [Devosia soli]|uniref:YihY/virulence factor BrkB family protein n=1 Tax=Devosia soli TaxID=361041 RepID=UPI00069CA691|nr:YihY/virulence factor BrkB family protein [Devosia soli]
MPTRIEELRSKQRDRGRRATTPLAIPRRGWKDIIYRLFIGFNANRILLTAAGVTYFLLFALVPSLSLFVSSYGLLNDPVGVVDQLALLDGVVPAGGLDIIREQLVRLTSQDTSSLSIAVVVSLAVALWGASAGVKALFDAMNVVYGEQEKRSFIRLNLLALGFVLAALVMLVLMLTVVLVMPVLLEYLAFGSFEWLVRVGAYSIMMVMLLIALSAIYRWGPSRALARWRWVTPGCIFAAIGIMIMSAGFSWYAANFSNYNATYGSLGALIGFLTWIWLSVTIVILGGALNSELEHQTTVDSTTGEPAPMGQRGAFVADTVGDRWPAHGGESVKG